MTVDSTWVDGNGYRPVHVTLLTASGAPTPFDREVLVELYPTGRFSNRGDLCVSRYVELPEGTASTTATVLVPQYRHFRNMAMDVWEDGRKLDELCVEGMSLPVNSEWTERLPKILVIDTDAPPLSARAARLRQYKLRAAGGENSPDAYRLPDIRGLASVLPYEDAVTAGPGLSTVAPASYSAARITDGELLNSLPLLDHIEIVPPGDIPDNWVGCSTFDMVFISWDDVQAMVAASAQRWQAIRSWAAAGGTLCVFGAGDQLERLGEIEQRCGLGPLDDSASVYRGWSVPNSREFGKEIALFMSTGRVVQQGNVMYLDQLRAQRTLAEPSAETTGEEAPEVEVKAPDSPPFVLRDMGLGTIVAMAAADPFPGTRREWDWLFNSLGSQRWLWYQRHGVSLRRENQDFWRFLIPGVGLAPVGAFRVLITLFVIVIGPVNYVVLRRWRKLNWLYLTIPLGAVCVTGSLFGYALLSDGLAVRVRVRSLTDLDQRRGQVVSWSRQSYYAGLAPSRGFSFPLDTAVIPLEHYPPTEYNRTDWRRRRLEWDTRQRLRSGYLSARTVSQLVVVRSSGQSSSRLIVTESDDDAPPTVENQLGGNIHALLLRNADGDYFQSQRIGNGGRALLSATTLDAAKVQLKTLFDEHPLELPEGFDVDSFAGFSAMNMGRYYYYWGNDANLPPPSTATSVLENKLRAVFAARGDPMPSGSYVAVVDRIPEVPLGVENAREQGSFHVVTGTW